MANLIRRNNREVARNRTQDYAMDPVRSWEPFRLMNAMLRWDPFRELGSGWAPMNESFLPRFDVKETKDGYLFRADMPGVKESDLENLGDGQRPDDLWQARGRAHRGGDQYHASERSYGQFARSFSLPDGADTDSVKADRTGSVCENGRRRDGG